MDNVQPGQNLGPYRIISQVGQGGMATVYKAYHAAMDRYVAVKVLPRQFAESPEFIGRFQQEARTIAKLEHPHILPVHDYGESGGVTYLVMRYLDAGTLKDRLASGPLPLPEIDRLFSQLTDALGYAHQRGVIHRDIKPSNVMVDSRGEVFLTDFGIAKLMEGAAQFTASGAITGTPAYMSPEQAQGVKLDPRTDIYSLGIVLYEMVTGRVPFEAETPLAVVLKHLNAPLPLPSTIKPDIAPSIERVILKALAKDRDDRFASCAELLAAWKLAMSEAEGAGLADRETVRAPATPAATATAPTMLAPTTAPAAEATAPAAKPAARRRSPLVWIAVGAVLVLAALGGFLIVQFASRRPPAAPAIAPTATVESVTAATPTQSQEATAPAIAPAPPAAAIGEPGWTSWAAANIVRSIAVRGDEIYTGGEGGLTVWNRADGTILRRFTTADGLPGIFVRAVLVDDDGTVWAATDGGVARFDGQNWTTYNAADGLDNPDVTVIARLGSQLIAGTQYGPPGSGLYQFDGQAWTPVPDFPSAYPDEQPDQLSNNVTVVLSDNAGGEWVGTTNGLGRFDGNAWRRYSTADGLPDNLIISLLIGSDGNLLAGTARGLAQFDGQKFTAWPRGPSGETFGMLQDLQGRYWFSGSGGGGLWRFDPAISNWDVFTKEANNLPTDTMLGAAQDQAGNLYFGSNGGGLVRYDGASFTTWAVPNVPTWNEFGIVLPAPGGELWFVRLYDSQTDRFDPRTETWSPVTGLPEGCRPLALDDKGNLLGGGNGGLWIVRADGRQTHVTVEQGLPSNVVTVVAVAKDTAWIGTDNGVASYDDQAGLRVFNVENVGLAGNNVFAILAASDGSVWVGADRGLSRLTPDGQWTHYTIGNPFGESLANVTDIAEDANNAIWVGTWNDAVYRFDGQAWQRFSPDDPAVQLPHSNVLSIAVAPDNSVWFGGYYSGATRFDGKEWRTFNVADGLIQLNVNDIFVDKDGTVWFATSGGVSRYRP